MKAVIKKRFRVLVGEYSAYYIYASPPGGSSRGEPDGAALLSVQEVAESTIRSSRAGWKRICLMIAWDPLRRGRPLTLKL